jgi:hypothetical protein
MQTLLVTLEPPLIELFLNYKASSGRGEPGTWVTRQTGKIRQTDKKIDQGLDAWMTPAGISDAQGS